MSEIEVNTKTTAEKTSVVKSGSFVQENQKSLLFIAAAIVVMIVIYIAYLRLYLGPREGEAAGKMYAAQDYWNNKEWDKAINGDAGYPGFKKIIADYSNTKT
ncbi:MAG: hypothetical protein EOO88_58905, partial [Pedobacter sp.]